MSPRRYLLTLLTLAVTYLFAGGANADIELRVSVKIFVDENGDRPIDGVLNEDREMRAAYDEIANRVPGVLARGYRFRVVEIVELHPNELPYHPADFGICDGGENDGGICGTIHGDCTGGQCMNLGLAACVGGDNNRDPCAQDGDCPGGTCDTPQNWIDAAVNWPTNQSIRDAAHADYDSGPNRFALRSSAVNIYVLGTPGGGVCNCAYRTGPESEAIIIVGQSHHETVPAHEVGHWLGLCHTHGCGNPSDDLSGGDETPIGVYDTLPDNPCWDDAAVIALMNFGACATGADCSAPCTIETERDCADVGGCFERGQSCYPTGTVGACVTCAADIPSCTTRNLAGCTTVGGAYFGDGSSCSMYQDLLNTEQRQQVDDVFNNLMSYHWESVGHDRLTADQMDRVTNIANGVQVAITSGCTHYVDLTANPSNLIGMTACGNAGICVGGSEAGTPCVSETEPWGDCPGGICKRNLDGSSESPYLAVQEGLEAVAGVDDIVLIRGGYYREPLTIMQSVTLRGSRGGAVLGAAGP